MTKEILDACCGSKMFHFDKNSGLIEFMDIRKENFEIHGKHINVSPDTVADFTSMPYGDGTFNLVIFDPPHLRWAGQKSFMRAQYGQLDENWPEKIRAGFNECWRVLRPGGTLVFKWSEAQIPLAEVLPLAPATPICGNKRVGPKSSTHWLVFYKVMSDELLNL